jgi:ABC-type multidrug transport system permease subunit
MSEIAITIILSICIVGFFYGMFQHSRFIKAGGQKITKVVPYSEQTESMRSKYRGMLIGYGVFFIGLIFMLIISAIWGVSGA